MIDIKKEEQKLNKHIEEYNEKYKQYLLQFLEKHNIKEDTTVVYSDRYDIIGVFKIIGSRYIGCYSVEPYFLKFFPITTTGAISKNVKDSLWSYNIENQILDYAPTKLDINNKKELAQIVKGLKNGDVVITDYLI